MRFILARLPRAGIPPKGRRAENSSANNPDWDHIRIYDAVNYIEVRFLLPIAIAGVGLRNDVARYVATLRAPFSLLLLLLCPASET